jgi:hypothetical protein
MTLVGLVLSSAYAESPVSSDVEETWEGFAEKCQVKNGAPDSWADHLKNDGGSLPPKFKLGSTGTPILKSALTLGDLCNSENWPTSGPDANQSYTPGNQNYFGTIFVINYVFSHPYILLLNPDVCRNKIRNALTKYYINNSEALSKGTALDVEARVGDVMAYVNQYKVVKYLDNQHKLLESCQRLVSAINQVLHNNILLACPTLFIPPQEESQIYEMTSEIIEMCNQSIDDTSETDITKKSDRIAKKAISALVSQKREIGKIPQLRDIPGIIEEIPLELTKASNRTANMTIVTMNGERIFARIALDVLGKRQINADFTGELYDSQGKSISQTDADTTDLRGSRLRHPPSIIFMKGVPINGAPLLLNDNIELQFPNGEYHTYGPKHIVQCDDNGKILQQLHVSDDDTVILLNEYSGKYSYTTLLSALNGKYIDIYLKLER